MNANHALPQITKRKVGVVTVSAASAIPEVRQPGHHGPYGQKHDLANEQLKRHGQALAQAATRHEESKVTLVSQELKEKRELLAGIG